MVDRTAVFSNVETTRLKVCVCNATRRSHIALIRAYGVSPPWRECRGPLPIRYVWLSSRGFAPGSAPGALVIGWNSGHTAVTLPDGTAVSSGESGGGVRVGGGGAHQPQFTD